MENTAQKFLVVGGYGEVGQYVVQSLLEDGYDVVIAGRSREKGEAFIAKTNSPRLLFRALDLAQFPFGSILEDITTVIMAAEPPNLNFVTHCFESGVRYLDISAESHYLQGIAELNKLAESKNALGILSVGIAPGLTNLLVKKVLTKTKNPTRVSIGVLLGVGDSHGAQAFDWTIENLLKWKKTAKPTKLNYGEPWGERLSYPFDFSDQYVLEKTYNVPVTTYMCFSSNLLTKIMFSYRNPLLAPIFRGMSKKLLHLLNSPMGSDAGYSLKVEAHDSSGSVSAITISGMTEAKITAIVTAEAAKFLAEKKNLVGVKHIHEVLSLTDIWSNVEKKTQAKLTKK